MKVLPKLTTSTHNTVTVPTTKIMLPNYEKLPVFSEHYKRRMRSTTHAHQCLSSGL